MSQFTKKAIIDSFTKLLNKYPLNKITIKDIVDDCAINRSTFYYYFEDIYALLNELLEIETQKALQISEGTFSWQEGFIKSTDFARQNKIAIYHIYNSINRDILDKYLYAVIDNMMNIIIHQEVKDLIVAEADIQILIDIYKFALVGMIYKWLQSGMKEEFNEIASRMYVLLGDNIRNTLIKTDPRYKVVVIVEKRESSNIN